MSQCGTTERAGKGKTSAASSIFGLRFAINFILVAGGSRTGLTV
jgi:hypothetical protein